MADISNVIIKDSPIAGNGLFATKKIVPGDLVLSISRPAVAALDAARLEDTCTNCFTWDKDSGEKIKKCLGCRVVGYCSKVGVSYFSRCLVYAIVTI
jgi:hypothetical protein